MLKEGHQAERAEEKKSAGTPRFLARAIHLYCLSCVRVSVCIYRCIRVCLRLRVHLCDCGCLYYCLVSVHTFILSLSLSSSSLPLLSLSSLSLFLLLCYLAYRSLICPLFHAQTLCVSLSLFSESGLVSPAGHVVHWQVQDTTFCFDSLSSPLSLSLLLLAQSALL